MRKTYKLDIESIPDTDSWISINTSLKGYSLCLLINRHLGTFLQRSSEDLPTCFDEQIRLPHYFWKDPLTEAVWRIIPNKIIQNPTASQGLLFQDIPLQKPFSPEKGDYFLKIEAFPSGPEQIEAIAGNISKLTGIIYAFSFSPKDKNLAYTLF